MKDADVCQGGEAVFSVRASDSPKMKWYRGDKQIENKGRFTIQDAKDGGNLNIISTETPYYYCLLLIDVFYCL